MIDDTIKAAINGLNAEHYVNTSTVCEIGGQKMTVWDVMKAALVRKLNVFLAGETGEGKTQLEKDVLGLFGNKGMFILGRNDLDIRELFRKISGEKLKLLQEGKLDSDQVKELTEKLGYHLFVVDEQTRCIPAVQNQLFNVYDGYIELEGKIYVTGSGYCVGVSSGNIGNGKYVGTSAQDRALLDRMHVLLDVDNADFSPNAVDFLQILSRSKGPRVKDSAGKEDKTQDIINAYDSLNSVGVPWEHYIGALYLRFGLDWLESTTHHSKRHAKNIWPNIPHLNDAEKAGDATLIYPVSTRAALTYLELAKGLRAVAEAKGATDIDETKLFLDTFRIAGAYSGIVNIDRVNRDNNYEGNIYTALGAVNEGIRTEFDTKMPVVFDAMSKAQKGIVDENVLGALSGRWQFMKQVVEYTARQNQPVETSLEDALKGGGE
jgi:chorismate mutase